MTTFKLSELGQKRLNPLAWSTNLWKLTNDLCECTSDPVCLDYANVAVGTPKTIVSITVDGVVVPVTSTSTANVSDLKDALEAAMAPYENGAYFELVTNGTNLLIKHYGATVVSLITWSASTSAMTRSCIAHKMCSYTGSDKGAVTPITLTLNNASVVTVAVAGGPYNHTATPVTDDATAVSFRTALYNALSGAGYVGVDANAGVNAITVTNNQTTSTFDIVLPRLKGVVAVSLTGTAFTKTGCSDDFAIS